MNNDAKPPPMTHAHDQFHGAMLAGDVQKLVHRWQQRRVAFERESFVAEIALLQRLLKKIGAEEEVERALAVNGGGFGLDAFLNSLAPFGVGNVDELDAYASAINAARFPRPLAVDLEVRVRLRRQETKRIQFRLDISKLPEEVKDAFAFVIFDDCRVRVPAGIPSCSRHIRSI